MVPVHCHVHGHVHGHARKHGRLLTEPLIAQAPSVSPWRQQHLRVVEMLLSVVLLRRTLSRMHHRVFKRQQNVGHIRCRLLIVAQHILRTLILHQGFCPGTLSITRSYAHMSLLTCSWRWSCCRARKETDSVEAPSLGARKKIPCLRSSRKTNRPCKKEAAGFRRQHQSSSCIRAADRTGGCQGRNQHPWRGWMRTKPNGELAHLLQNRNHTDSERVSPTRGIFY